MAGAHCDYNVLLVILPVRAHSQHSDGQKATFTEDRTDTRWNA